MRRATAPIWSIQGPPGTGKSQTIANIVAAAVADGKTVLFVAEKMAALDVVKRRLDAIGLGDMCLELHSSKARKREVLQELRRTWELGQPNEQDDEGALRRLEATRDTLNGHVARLHRVAGPGQLSAYQCIGELVRLGQEGYTPSDISLENPDTWSRTDRTEREQVLIQLADYVEDLGIPARHPWRGVGLDAILRTGPRPADYAYRCGFSTSRLLTATRELLCQALEAQCPETFPAIEDICELALGVAEAPEDLDRDVILAPCWSVRGSDIEDLVKTGETLAAVQKLIGNIFASIAWTTDVQMIRRNFAIHGGSWLRGLKGEWRRADALFRSLLAEAPPKSTSAQLQLLDELIAGQRATANLKEKDDVGRSAFGRLWRREKSDWAALRRIVDWNANQQRAGIDSETRQLAAKIADRQSLGTLAQKLQDASRHFCASMTQLTAELRLDLDEAFSMSSLDQVQLTALGQRLSLWRDHTEDLSKWISYRIRADQARVKGLSHVVDRLADGRLDRSTVLGAFEMAYYEALLRWMVMQDLDLARFDGDAHSRVVHEFRELDAKRLELARWEVAAAHYQRMPSRDGAAGPLGVLKGEMARRAGHMPIRRLMRRAGPVIQAIKPVFMMGPLSIAQFLEPGALGFDLLVIDEASQVQPVDALGAIAKMPPDGRRR